VVDLSAKSFVIDLLTGDLEGQANAKDANKQGQQESVQGMV
jgi:hypothetical protein